LTPHSGLSTSCIDFINLRRSTYRALDQSILRGPASSCETSPNLLDLQSTSILFPDLLLANQATPSCPPLSRTQEWVEDTSTSNCSLCKRPVSTPHSIKYLTISLPFQRGCVLHRRSSIDVLRHARRRRAVQSRHPHCTFDRAKSFDDSIEIQSRATKAELRDEGDTAEEFR